MWNRMQKVLLLTFVLVVALAVITDATVKSCRTTKDGKEKDDKHEKKNCPANVNFCIKFVDGKDIYRHCDSNNTCELAKSTSYKIDNGTVYCCDKDNCNGANGLKGLPMLVTIASVIPLCRLVFNF